MYVFSVVTWIIWKYVLHDFICIINIIFLAFSMGKGEIGGKEQKKDLYPKNWFTQ